MNLNLNSTPALPSQADLQAMNSRWFEHRAPVVAAVTTSADAIIAEAGDYDDVEQALFGLLVNVARRYCAELVADAAADVRGDRVRTYRNAVASMLARPRGEPGRRRRRPLRWPVRRGTAAPGARGPDRQRSGPRRARPLERIFDEPLDAARVPCYYDVMNNTAAHFTRLAHTLKAGDTIILSGNEYEVFDVVAGTPGKVLVKYIRRGQVVTMQTNADQPIAAW